MHKYLFLIVTTILLSSTTQASEYHGKYLDSLQGEFLYQPKSRPTFQLRSIFRFEDSNSIIWTVPIGQVVDGASIPQALWSILGGPFDGNYLNASVIHDHYCKTKEKTAYATHRAFYDAMLASGVSQKKALIMYWAVKSFGPDWEFKKRLTYENICDISGKCEQLLTESIETVSLTTPDLNDPLVLALSRSKLESIAKTMNTTDGLILDTTAHGQILASLNSIDANSNMYRNNLVHETFRANPESLGALALWTDENIDAIPSWASGAPPEIKTTFPLIKNTKLDEQKAFLLDNEGEQILLQRLEAKIHK